MDPLASDPQLRGDLGGAVLTNPAQPKFEANDPLFARTELMDEARDECRFVDLVIQTVAPWHLYDVAERQIRRKGRCK